ncbi:uncharacterized protein [Ptychodera flava]|uniref:uncharacterized protein n=1 Tax=Ptychodera flava TaxID=63121 RepID=UPI00396A6435
MVVRSEVEKMSFRRVNSTVFLLAIFLTVVSGSGRNSSQIARKGSGYRPWMGIRDGQEWIKQLYPNPQTLDGSIHCGRGGNVSYICDPNGVLTMEEADLLEKDLEEIRRVTACICRPCLTGVETDSKEEFSGFVIGIAIVNKMIPTLKIQEEQTEEDLQEEAKRWASFLLRDLWGLGHCGNDAVVFISAKDNKISTATGQLVGGILTTTILDSIHEQGQEYFADGDFYTGLQVILREYNTTLIGGIRRSGMSTLAVYGIVFLSMSVPLLVFVAIHNVCTTRDGKTFICSVKKSRRSDAPVYVAASV